ncbi:hypothetical protein GCM10009007_05300 [Formosimonas limnophila]|uniref:HEAT repeat domain-containing protein n=1 Tax=Formosimonas limnophila TaxID=1384487 RepID=A0A8J3CK15_9BURK|nr:hypothetical protein [Formosimonas limnophila]GHA67581.1 hypothetical protein GCM10009007_05300 [Formosimonas limnophila]
MGNLKNLILNASKGISALEFNYSDTFPPNIAEQCGEDEVIDVLLALNDLSKAREEHDAGEDSWDGDTSDDLWRAQVRYGKLLVQLIPRFPLQVAEVLKSNHGHTRFWAAYAFNEVPIKKAIAPLKVALTRETEKLNRTMIEKALTKCLRKKWIPFVS